MYEAPTGPSRHANRSGPGRQDPPAEAGPARLASSRAPFRPRSLPVAGFRREADALPSGARVAPRGAGFRSFSQGDGLYPVEGPNVPRSGAECPTRPACTKTDASGDPPPGEISAAATPPPPHDSNRGGRTTSPAGRRQGVRTGEGTGRASAHGPHDDRASRPRTAPPAPDPAPAAHGRGSTNRAPSAPTRERTGVRASRHITKKCAALGPQGIPPDRRKTEGSDDGAGERARRAARYGLREWLWRHSSQARIRGCGWVPATATNGPGPKTPELLLEDGRAHYAGVARCGSVWSCPVCSPGIRHGRADEIRAGAAVWLEGGELRHENARRELHYPARPDRSLIFLTLTMPHDHGEPLPELMETIRAAWRAVWSSRRGKALRDRYGIALYVRNWDATHGGHGWHPHIHALLFLEGTLDAAELRELEAELYDLYARAVERRGHRRPSSLHGIHLETVARPDELAGYLTRIMGEETGRALALELTRSDLKRARAGHRTPLEILAHAADDDRAAAALWREWECGTTGRHFTQWSGGARAVLQLAAQTDGELIEPTAGGAIVHRFRPDQWHAVRAARGAAARVLNLAETIGRAAVVEYVDHLTELDRARRRDRWRARWGGRPPPAVDSRRRGKP